MNPPPTQRTFQQGDLDALCGVYAIVNASCRAIGDWLPAGSQPRALFRHVIRHADVDAVTDGIDAESLVELLACARDWIARHWRIAIAIERPFASESAVAPNRLLGRLSTHLAQPRASAIIEMSGDLEHWTCIDDVAGHRVLVRDSHRRQFFRTRTFRRAGRPGSRHPVPQSLFLIRARKRHG